VLVGATTSTDSFWSGGNRFPSVDIYAPGGSITTAVNSSDTASGVESGTSLAAPHVAGVLAIIKQHYPEYLRNERLTKLYTLSSWAPGISQYIVGNGGAAGPPGNGQVPPGTGPYFPGNSLLPAVIFPLLLQ
jgi:subtilisin family serine protease